jgi:hypothetical protein
VTGSASLGTALRVADVSVDAWSVGGGSALALFGERFAGIETKLFQAGLLPYLVYLYFLGKKETATPRASLFGARFLLLFVAATIPAGIVAKTSYGDILANVDVLHGSSETLLSVSNFLFAFGFYEALETSRKKNKNRDDDVFEASPETQTETSETRLSPTTALLLLAALAGFGSYGAGHLIHSEPATRFLTEQMHARAEPSKRALRSDVGRARLKRHRVGARDAARVTIRVRRRLFSRRKSERKLAVSHTRDDPFPRLWFRRVHVPRLLQPAVHKRARAVTSAPHVSRKRGVRRRGVCRVPKRHDFSGTRKRRRGNRENVCWRKRWHGCLFDRHVRVVHSVELDRVRRDAFNRGGLFLRAVVR